MRIFSFWATLAICCEFAFAQESQQPAVSDSATVQFVPNSGDAEAVGLLESRVEANPEDLISRAQLLRLYMNAGSEANFMQHLTWLIAIHPDSPALSLVASMRPGGGPFNSAADYREVAGLWEAQVAAHPESPRVLYNYARFLGSSDPGRAAELLERARKLDSTDPAYVQQEASLFSDAVARPAASAVDNRGVLRVSIMNSTDSELLSVTGEMLARTPATKEIGIQMLEKAVLLDPDNRRLRDRLSQSQNPQPVPGGPLTIGARVAEANLIKKVEPQYPALAQSARVSGNVEFTVTIGEDGSVKNIQLLRGHPLLVNAAKDAVLQWRYRPTLLNGNPVAIITNVIVPFNLIQ